ncbi:MAG: hypothetical protein ACRDIL_20250 [Candidatus Limnocylindrales bacterium]
MRRTRRRPGRVGPAPELVAVAAAIVLYGGAFLAGNTILAGSPTAPAQRTPGPGQATPSPAPSLNPLRGDINTLLEVDSRLIPLRQELRDILTRSPFRASEVAATLRRIKTNLPPGIERASRLAQSPATREVGAQLELLYASASATIDRAADLSLGSDQAYRGAAEQIIDLFTDLPAIDERLAALLEPVASAPPSSPSPSPTVSISSSSPAPTASPSGSAVPSPSEVPGDLLHDGGFEEGIGTWTMRIAGSANPPRVAPGPPLGASGSRSLQVVLTTGGSPSSSVGFGQSPIRIEAGTWYVARVSLRSSVPASVQLRVVGPSEETYGITVIRVGPTVSVGELRFPAIVDDPATTFWIDIAPSAAGTVLLDDASLAPAVD